MSVHVQFETPEDLANKIYDMIDLNKNGRVKKGSNEVTKAAERVRPSSSSSQRT